MSWMNQKNNPQVTPESPEERSMTMTLELDAEQLGLELIQATYVHFGVRQGGGRSLGGRWDMMCGTGRKA